MDVYCTDLLSSVSGWWTLVTGGHSITAAGAGEAQRSHCQNLSTSKYNLAEAAGCWEMSRRLGPGTPS